ncbi:MAG: hypothetical protein ABI878_14825 [Acidobacteriota bacterium]
MSDVKEQTTTEASVVSETEMKKLQIKARIYDRMVMIKRFSDEVQQLEQVLIQTEQTSPTASPVPVPRIPG